MLNFLGYTLGGALCVGASVIPSIMFSGLVFQHAGEYAYLLPVVMVIMVEKSCVFLVQAFGSIRNPMKLLLSCLGLGILGAAISMFGTLNPALWALGATLMGAGMAVYAPMFRTFRDGKRREGTWESGAAIPASYLVLVAIIAVVFFLRHSAFQVVMGIYLALLVLEFAFMLAKWRTLPNADEPMFDRATRSRHAVAYTVAAALATFAVCFYRETAEVRYALVILAAYTILLIVVALVHREPFHGYSVRTFWYGAMRVFLNTFSLVYFTATGQVDLVFVSYVMYGLGIGLAKLTGALMRKVVPQEHYEQACIVGALLSACLMFTFSPVPYFVGMLLGVTFVSMGNSASAHLYLDDDAYPFNERYLIRRKFFSVGAVTGQGLLMVVLLVVAGVMKLNGGELLSAYVYSRGSMAYSPAFGWTLAICLAAFAVAMVPQLMPSKDRAR